MVQDRAILTMTYQWKVVYGLSNGAIFSDLEQPLTQFLRSRYYLTLNISETVRYRHSYDEILTGFYPLSRMSFRMTLSDLK